MFKDLFSNLLKLIRSVPFFEFFRSDVAAWEMSVSIQAFFMFLVTMRAYTHTEVSKLVWVYIGPSWEFFLSSPQNSPQLKTITNYRNVCACLGACVFVCVCIAQKRNLVHPWYLHHDHTKIGENESSFGQEIDVCNTAKIVCMFSHSVHAHAHVHEDKHY